MLDAVLAAGAIEGMTSEHGSRPRSVFGQVGELNAVIGEHDFDLVGNGFDELLEGRRCIVSKRLRLQRNRPPRPRASLNRREEIFAETIDSRAHFQWRTQLQWRHRWLSSLRLR